MCNKVLIRLCPSYNLGLIQSSALPNCAYLSDTHFCSQWIVHSFIYLFVFARPLFAQCRSGQS